LWRTVFQLVERKGKFLVTNWKDYDVMKEFP